MSMEYIHDVDETFQQETSPLQLLGEDLFGENAQRQTQTPLMITQQTGQQPGDEALDDQELYNQMFKPVPEGLKIRPQLSTNDLDLVRQMFVHFCRTTEYSTTTAEIKQLYARVLRKVPNVH